MKRPQHMLVLLLVLLLALPEIAFSQQFPKRPRRMSELQLVSTNGTNYINFGPREGLSVNYTLQLPNSAPTNNALLFVSQAADGHLSWTSNTPSNGDVLGFASGVPNWITPQAGWGLTGTSNSVAGTNFIGTIDSVDLVFKTENQERLRILATGAVGIGTSTPSAALHLIGTAIFSDSVTLGSTLAVTLTSSFSGVSTFSAGATMSNTLLLNPNGIAAGNTSELRMAELAANGAEYVGFKAPDVITANRIWTLPAQDGSIGQVLSTDGTGNLSWASVPGGTSWGLLGNSGTNPSSNYIGTSDNQPLVLRANATEYVRILATGLVGIGTSTPTSTIHVAGSGVKSANFGTALVSNTATTNTQNVVKTGLEVQATGAWTATGAVNRGLYVNATGGTTNYAAIFEGGNVGIGTSTPSQLLDVMNGNVVINNNDNTARELRFEEPSGSGANYTGFRAGVQAADVTYTLPTGAPSSNGQVLSSTTAGVMSWITAGASFGGLTAAGLANTIDNASFAQTWQWNTLGSASALTLSSNSTSASNNSTGQTILNIALSGANGVGVTSYGMQVSNTHTGNSSTNIGGYFTASGATNNYGLIVAAGNVGVGTTAPGSALDVKGTLRLSGATSGFVGFAPAAAAGSTTYTLPSADGTSGQLLSTNGAGVLSWATGLTTASVTGTANTVPKFTGTNAIGNSNITDNGTTVTVASAFSATGATNINASNNAATNINTGTSTGTVTIGGTGAMTINIGAGGTGAKNIAIGDGASTGSTIIDAGTGGIRLASLTTNGLVTTGSTNGTLSVTTTSSGLASAISDETGTGALVLGTSPTITTPTITTPTITFSTSAGVTAGTNAQGQGALTNDYNVITTASSNPSGVTLPTATVGRRIIVVNRGANTVNVYPATGGIIDGLATNASIAVPASGYMEFNASSATQWYSTSNLTASGSAVTSFSGGTTGLTPSTATTGAVTLGGTLAVANGGTGVTTSTGTGSVVLSTSPTLVTPALGTPSSVTLTNATGLPISTGVSGLGTGVATMLATPSSANVAAAVTDESGTGALVFANSPTLVTPSLGTPSSVTLTNATGLPISTGVSGLGTGVATMLATPTSANVAAAVTDETGSGLLVFGTSPSITTPTITTPTITFSTSTGLTAGTNAQGQLALTSDYNIITTAGNNPSGATLPTATVGRRIIVVNRGANPVNVYPAAGAAIDGLAANAAISLPASGYMEFNASSATQWYSTGNLTATGSTVSSFSGGTTGLTPSTASTGAVTLSGTLAVANGGTGVTTSTGTGSVVLSTSPTLVTPALGTPSSVTLTNATGLPISTGVSGLGTGVATMLATPTSANVAAAVTDETGTGALVFANSPTLVTPALGTPSSVTLTNATGLPISTGVSGLGTGVATLLGTPSSANLASAITDETGTGLLVFGTSPSITTPTITFSTSTGLTAGTNTQGQLALTSDYNIITTAGNNPSGATLPTATVGRRIIVVNRGANPVNVYPAAGAAIDGLAANAAISLPASGYMEFNASSATQWYSTGNLTATGSTVSSFSGGTTGLMPSTASTGAVTLSGTLAVANGGTGLNSYTTGDLLVASGATTLAKLAGVATGNVLLSGGVGTAPSWGKVDLTSAVTGVLPIANGGTGSATQSFVDLTTEQTAIAGAKTFTSTLTASAGATIAGGATSINDNSNNATNINTGTSTGTVTIGGTGAMTINIGAGGTGAKTIAIGDGATTGSTTISSGSGGITLAGTTTLSNANALRLAESDANGANYVALKGPDNVAANVTWTLPGADGTDGQFLATNGAGTLAWSSVVGGVASTGTANYVTKFTSASAVANSLIYDDGTNVAIGTSTPTAMLDVRSPAAGTVGLSVRAAATPTTNIVEVENSAGTALVSVNSNGNLALSPTGTAAGATNEVRFLELTANGTNHVGFKAPDAIGTDRIYTLPASDGSDGDVLSTDGAGVTTWVTPRMRTVFLSTNATANGTTTLTSVTGLETTVAAGTYKFEYNIIYRSAATTTGIGFAVDHSGTATTFVATHRYSAIGTGNNQSPAATAASAAGERMGSSQTTRTLGGLIGGNTASVDAANSNMYSIVEGVITVTTSGTLRLMHQSEVAASNVTIQAGTSLILTKLD